jgi:hypothetical protein
MLGKQENASQEKGEAVSRGAGRQGIGAGALGRASWREGNSTQKQETAETQAYAGKVTG